MDRKNFEKCIFEKGLSLLEESRGHGLSLFDKNRWYKKILARTMVRQKFKTDLFRFIDVLPALSGEKQLLSHFEEYLRSHEALRAGAFLSRLAPSFSASQIKKRIRQVAEMFIVGERAEEALPVLVKNGEKGLSFSVDILGEAVLSEAEADDYARKYSGLMKTLLAHDWDQSDSLQKDVFGKIPAVNVSIKPSALFSQIRPQAWEPSKEGIKSRLRPLFRQAVRSFVFVNLDMERYFLKNLFLELFKELLMEPEFKDYPHFGIVCQAYLKESFQDLKELVDFAKKRKCPLTVRLVKGAYWDSEILEARQKNQPIPVYTEKNEMDANFEDCAHLLFAHWQYIKVAIGSHNVRSIACAMALKEQRPQADLEFQFLYGMEGALAQALVQRGFRARLYCAVGEMIPGMSYLVRRLLENSSSQSFILNAFMKRRSEKELLASPFGSSRAKDSSYRGGQDGASSSKTGDRADFSQSSVLDKDDSSNTNRSSPRLRSKKPRAFKNHRVMDFSQSLARKNFEKALSGWRNQFPINVPAFIEGQPIRLQNIFKRPNPARHSQMISLSHWVGQEEAKKAVQVAKAFFKEWSLSPPSHRIACLRRLAGLMRKEEFELSSLQVFEVGKTWAEAQADVAEAIDFCEYYALSYERICQGGRTAPISGEESGFRFEAIGPAVVIAPWNFPLAILTGMTVAPLVCGNTVLIKPAEQSPACGLQLARLLLKSGFPPQSFAFLPGRGEEIGKYLAEHNEIPIISFTGSFEVGAQILRQAGKIMPGQKEIKKCVVEMGGKNAIIIDSSADLDEAVSGVLQSAFAFQGQKCSACSRLIVLEDIYERFMERFLPAVSSWEIGPPEEARFHIGPLIDEDSYKRTRDFVQQEKSPVLFKGAEPLGLEGWFQPPVVFSVENSHLPLMQKELFAPILACLKVKDFDQALLALNDSRFGLTAGLYSRRPSHIESFSTQVEAGNLYINRNCTGALVERHPFGGRKLSGLGSKAGGPDYIKQFLHTKIVTENSMRRGFAPDLFEEDFASSTSS